MEDDKTVFDKAIKVIGGHKSTITRASGKLLKVIDDGEIADGNVAAVRAAKVMVEKQIGKIESHMDDLLGNENMTEEVIEGFTDYLLEQGGVVEQVSTILASAEALPVKQELNTTVLDTSGLGAAICESFSQMPLRQPISVADLPLFYGDPAEYTPFIEAFNFLVHENENYPDAIKAQYLKKCFPEKTQDGKPNSAHALLRLFIPTAQNYSIMRKKLEDRYKIGYLNKITYLTNLRKLSTWNKCRNGTEVRKLLDYIQENLELLELAGGSSVNESDMLLADILALIPQFIIDSFLELPEVNRTLARLLKQMEKSANRMLEKDVLVPRTNHTNNSGPGHYPRNTNQRSGYNKPSFVYQSSQVPTSNSCIFCGKDHSSFNCRVGTVQDRLATAREKNFCHNCLKSGHFSASCWQSSNCACGKTNKHCGPLCIGGDHFHSSSSGGTRGSRGSNRTRGSSHSRGANNARGGHHNTNPGNAVNNAQTDQQGSSTADTNAGNRPRTNPNYVVVDPDISMSSITNTECFMEVGRGYVKSSSSDDYVELRFLFDTASNASYGKGTSLMNVACTKVDSRNFEVDIMGEGEVKCQDCDVVKLLVSDPNNHFEPIEVCITLLDRLCKDVPSWQLTHQQKNSIRNYQLSDPKQISGNMLPIDVLIGLDNYWKFISHQVDDPGFGPKLRFSKLGWILSGPRDFARPRLLTSSSRNPLTACVQTTLFTNIVESPYSPDISDKLEFEPMVFANKAIQSDEEEYCSRFSDLETFGIKPEAEISPILEDFNHNIAFNSATGRYQVRLPFVGRLKDKLGNNYAASKVRLESLFNKIRKPGNAEFAKKYYDIITEQEKLGIIERVNDTSGEHSGYYIGHHGVFKDESDKLRVVMDGSSPSETGISINDCLSPGPPLTNELIEMLMRFRTHEIVLSGDIVAAFLQLEVALTDRDYLKLLWYDQDGQLVTYRFTRVPFGLRCSSFLLNATLRFHMQQKCLEADNPSLLELLSKSQYVDDWLVGARSVEEVLFIKATLAEFLEGIGMKLHKFNSSSAAVRQVLEADCPERDSVLGLQWDVLSDEVSINIDRALRKMRKEVTKCELYSAPPRIFDPLGFFQPFMFTAKLMFQEVCKAKIKWKAKLPSGVCEDFEKWKSQIHKLKAIKLPRHILLPNYDTAELHGFADASLLGYCACVYLVSVCGTQRTSHLVVSKTRVAPLKEMSIPRLELTAAFLLARLMALVIKFHSNVKFDKVFYYSDSTTTLHWIMSDHKHWKTYVANRVRDINLLSCPEDWKYVNTNNNPADLGTRGIDADSLVGNKLWFEGPAFLISDPEGMSQQTPDLLHPSPDSLAERRRIVTVAIEKIASVEKMFPLRKNGSPRKLTDYSDVDHVLNILGYCYKLIRLWIGEACFSKWLGYEPGIADSFTMISEQRLVRAVQHDSFAPEISFCRGNPKVIPSGMKVVSSKVQQLKLFLDERGLLRVNTRLGNALIPESAKEPMLLPKHHHFTSMVIWRIHTRLKHAGVDRTLAEMRQMYWVPQGRQAIRSILRQCGKCRMMSAAPYPILAPPPLPDFRVQRVECFHSTGVDFAGPLVIGTLSNVKRKRKQKKGTTKAVEKDLDRKVWLVIFTCAVSRNVHSEVLDGMTVADFMHGLRRFVARYGPPALFYSDNAPTFECVAKELPQVLAHPRLTKYLNTRKITWKFYVQKAPWMGGFIERVVGLFKSAIKRVLGRARLDYQEFVTLICELNGMLNSRPISYVYDTVGEEEPITPSKLWCGKNITMFPPFYEARFEGYDPEICVKRMRYLDKVLTHCWNRLSSDYIVNLSERHLSRNLPNEGRQPKVGELVLVKNDKLQRGQWKIGRVDKVTPGPDGVIRRVELKLPNIDKKKGSDRLNRPPRLLVPLEAEVDRLAMENK